MDSDISRWILDFILRQPSLDDSTLDKLLRVLPLPIGDPTFKKALLLRSIASEISEGVASEEMLVLLEHIEELDYQAGLPPSPALKTAYCDVAVDFTARLLEGSRPNYSEAVNRVWGKRVALMMESEQSVGLLSDDLRNWKYDIEASVERVDDSSLFPEDDDDDDLLNKWRGAGYETMKSLRVYVEEAWAKMGPSFLEKVVQIVGSEQIRQVLYPNDHHQHPRRINDEVAATAGKRGAEMVKRSRILHPRRKCSRGAKLSSDISEEMDGSSVKKPVESVVKDDPPPPPVGPSMAAVEDKEVIDLELENENVIDLDSEHGDEIDASKKKDEKENVIDLESENGDENEASKSRNENETGPHCNRRVLPPSSTQQHVYSSRPLKRKDMNLQNGMRRRRKFWSNLEEDTLVNAVKMYGIGNWKFILKQYKDVFDERTEGDLKDKWRNLIR